MIQEFIEGVKHATVFLVDEKTEPKRFFIHKCIREYPITGGPTCFLESVFVDEVFEYGLKLLKAINFYGLAQMEFIVDNKDGVAKLTEFNPRFYGCIQGAITAGVNFPYDFFQLLLGEKLQPDFSYKIGEKCRHLLFDDTFHMLAILKGKRSPKYQISKIRTLLNYFKFHQDNAYYILSWRDPVPAVIKILSVML